MRSVSGAPRQPRPPFRLKVQERVHTLSPLHTNLSHSNVHEPSRLVDATKRSQPAQAQLAEAQKARLLISSKIGRMGIGRWGCCCSNSGLLLSGGASASRLSSLTFSSSLPPLLSLPTFFTVPVLRSMRQGPSARVCTASGACR